MWIQCEMGEPPRPWCSGYHGCLPSSRSGFDSRRSHAVLKRLLTKCITHAQTQLHSSTHRATQRHTRTHTLLPPLPNTFAPAYIHMCMQTNCRHMRAHTNNSQSLPPSNTSTVSDAPLHGVIPPTHVTASTHLLTAKYPLTHLTTSLQCASSLLHSPVIDSSTLQYTVARPPPSYTYSHHSLTDYFTHNTMDNQTLTYSYAHAKITPFIRYLHHIFACTHSHLLSSSHTHRHSGDHGDTESTCDWEIFTSIDNLLVAD